MEVTPLHHEDHCAFGEVEDIETKEYKHVTLSLSPCIYIYVPMGLGLLLNPHLPAQFGSDEIRN